MAKELGFIRRILKDQDSRPELDSMNLIYLQDEQKYVLQVGPFEEMQSLYFLKSKKMSRLPLRYSEEFDCTKVNGLTALSSKMDSVPIQIHPYYCNLITNSTFYAHSDKVDEKGKYSHVRIGTQSIKDHLDKFGITLKEQNRGKNKEICKPYRLQTYNNDRSIWPQLSFNMDYTEISITIWNSETDEVLLTRTVQANFQKRNDQYHKQLYLVYSSPI